MRTFRNTNFKISFVLSLSVIPNFSTICRLGKTGKFSNTATRRKCSWKQPHFRNIKKKLAIFSRCLFKRNDFSLLFFLKRGWILTSLRCVCSLQLLQQKTSTECYIKCNSAGYPHHNIFQFPTASHNMVDGRILTAGATIAKHFLTIQ